MYGLTVDAMTGMSAALSRSGALAPNTKPYRRPMKINHIDHTALAELARAYLREIDDALVRAEGALGVIGVELSCRPGCSACCSLPVNATYPEAVFAVAYIRERFSPDEIRTLVERADEWIAWSGNELSGYANGADLASVYSLYGPGCPLLKDGLCSIYPVRPMGCRVHCSTSDPALCGPEKRHSPLYNPSGFVEEVVAEVKPFCLRYRQYLEEMGIDFESSLRPLSEMLVELLCWRRSSGAC